ncbi:hypothetical protein B0H63DRAFT_108407 [Podospora didyma]|uniref:Uncharacterized protein n=1 Tax=Podospora didyma TaxID=330526 RepID=A0AAE0U4I6_9PEZI|nr:hypothetical protein B0H63DRAFT_108407 [Podospora didyma]
MSPEASSSWLSSISLCCGLNEKPRAGTPEKPIVVLRDQPVFIPQPTAEPIYSSERTYEKTQERERERLGSWRSSSRGSGSIISNWISRPTSRRPQISGPTNFRHLHSDSFQFPSPQVSQLLETHQRPRSFRPLELSIYAPENQLSPILPHLAGTSDLIAPPPRAYTSNSSKWDASSVTLTNLDRSNSSMSFHIPRKHVRQDSSVSQVSQNSLTPPRKSSLTPPRIPPKSRARAYTAPSKDRIVERIASAMLEKERLEAEIESVIERQSLYISSRPSTAYSVRGESEDAWCLFNPGFPNPRLTASDLEPMPSIPAMPAAAPSFAERLSSDVNRPRTAPASQRNFPSSGISSMKISSPQESTAALQAAAFTSHPTPPQRPYRQDSVVVESSLPTSTQDLQDNSRPLERPLAPPLPLMLRPPLRKKKSFSRVSSWLFPGGEDPHRRQMSFDSVTNMPKPVKGGEGFYQCVSPPGRTSMDTLSSASTWETEEEGQTVPTTTWSPGSSPVIQNTPKHTPTIEEIATFVPPPQKPEPLPTPAQQHSSAQQKLLGVLATGHRPQSVGVAF